MKILPSIENGYLTICGTGISDLIMTFILKKIPKFPLVFENQSLFIREGGITSLPITETSTGHWPMIQDLL